jgi:hypothetical protein
MQNQTFHLKISDHKPTSREENWKIIDTLKEEITHAIKEKNLDFI